MDVQAAYEAKYKRRDQAARVIQAAWRGCKQRRNFQRLQAAVRLVQNRIRTWGAKRTVKKLRDRQDEDERFTALMDRHRQRMLMLEKEKRVILAMPAGDLDDWELKRIRAAAKVQAHWRGYKARQQYAQLPDRVQREQAALRIQSVFKGLMAARRSSVAVSTDQCLSTAMSPLHLRQSGTSVLMGSPPELRASTASASMQPQGAAAWRASSGVMSNKRAMELEAQVKGRVDAYKALSKGKGRGNPQQVQERLAHLLSLHNNSMAGRTANAHQRQRNMMLMEALCGQLEQVVPLSELSDSILPQDFPRPPKGSERMERASQAHALMLAEARVGAKWWTHLKGLNTQAVQATLLAEDEERWQALDTAWRSTWDKVLAEEATRPDEVLQEQAAHAEGPGKMAVAAAKQARAEEAQKAAYAVRASAVRNSIMDARA